MRNKLTKNLNTVTLILLAVVLFVSCPLIAYAAALQSHFSLGGSITYEYRQRINYEFLDVENFFDTRSGTLQPINAGYWNTYSNKVDGTEFVIDARGIAAEIGDEICYGLDNNIYFSGTVILGGDLYSISPSAFSPSSIYFDIYIDTLIIDINVYNLSYFPVIDFSGITVRQLLIGGNGSYDWRVAPILRSLPNTIETFVCEAPISEIENQACSECRKLSVFDADLSGCSRIGEKAFYNCWDMPMPTNIRPTTIIGQDAFANVSFPRRKIRNIATGKIHDGYIVDAEVIDTLLNEDFSGWQQTVSFVPDYLIAANDVTELMDLITRVGAFNNIGLYTDSVLYFTSDAINYLYEILNADGNLDRVLNILDLFYFSALSYNFTTTLEFFACEYGGQELGHFYHLPYANVLFSDPMDGIGESVIEQLFVNDYNYVTDASYIDNLDKHIDETFDVTRNDLGEANGVIYKREQYPILYNTYFEYVEEYSYPVIRNYVDCL